jgi:hydroxyacylglutathione hydrolase
MFNVSQSLWIAETNSYIVAKDTAGPCVVIDAPPDVNAIASLLAKHDLYPEAVLLTHGHIDHMGGSGELFDLTGAATYVHPDDDFLTLAPMEQLRGLMGVTPDGRFDAPVVREPLVAGQILDLAGLSLEVLHTPGHSPGHCCFVDRGEAVLWSGDQLFASSIGRTDLPGGSTSELFASMRQQIMTLDDDTVVMPGHGPPTSIGVERRSNPFREGWAG